MTVPERPGGIFTTETVVNPLAGTLLDLAAAIESIPTPGSEEATGTEDLEKLPLETRPGDAVVEPSGKSRRLELEKEEGDTAEAAAARRGKVSEEV